MKSTTKKNLLAALLIVASAALLVVGFFAYFSDRGDADTVATAGTVRIDVENETDPNDLNNINPGDHDWGLADYLGAAWTDITDGSLHPIALSVENVGNKSVKIRNSIDLIIDFAKDEFVLGDEFMFFLTETEDREEVGAKELEKKYFLFKEPGATGKIFATLYFEVDASDGVTTAGYYAVDASDKPDSVNQFFEDDFTECIGIRYIVFDADPTKGYILQGVESSPGAGDAEDDPSDGLAADANEGYTYYLGLKAGADNSYQSATVNINWSVEAIQHRNTDSTVAWTKISSTTLSGKVPAWNEDAAGSVLVPAPTPDP